MAVANTSCDVARLSAEKDFSLDLGPFACVKVDAARALDISTVLNPEGSAAFRPVASGLVDFGFGSARYWVRVKLINDSAAQGTWWITHDIPMADLVRVRLVAASGEVQSLLNLSGDAPFGARGIPSRHLVSSVTLDAGDTVEIVIDYVTGQSTQMPLFAESVASFVDRTQSEMAKHLLIIVLLLGMGTISTLYFYSLEGPPALIYGAYVLTTATMLAHMEGYGVQLLYPQAVSFNRFGFPVLGFGSLALGMLFISRLTRTCEHAPLLYSTGLSF